MAKNSCPGVYAVYYCAPAAMRGVGLAFIVMLLLVLFVAMGFVAGELLLPNLTSISEWFALPHVVAGLTLLAFGNGAPDLVGTYESFKKGEVGLAVGELVGAAFFIVSIVLGSLFILYPFDIVSDTDADVDADTMAVERHNSIVRYLRDVGAFALSVCFVILFLKDGLQRWELWVMVCLYIGYVTCVVSWEWWSGRKVRRLRAEDSLRGLWEEDVRFYPVFHKQSILNALDDSQLGGLQLLDDGALNAHVGIDISDSVWKSYLSKVSLFITKILRYIVPVLSIEEIEDGNEIEDISKWKQMLSSLVISPTLISLVFSPLQGVAGFILCVIASLGSYYIYLQLKSTNSSKFLRLSVTFIGFFAAISFISILSSQVISILTLISDLSQIKQSLVGLTLFALGNSTGDFVSCIIIGKRYPLMALSACIGGPLLNLLLGLGVSGLLTSVQLSLTPSIIICSVGLLINLCVLFSVSITGWSCNRAIGICMVAVWVFGISIAFLIEMLIP